jgi:hypothetical protein
MEETKTEENWSWLYGELSLEAALKPITQCNSKEEHDTLMVNAAMAQDGVEVIGASATEYLVELVNALSPDLLRLAHVDLDTYPDWFTGLLDFTPL